MNQKNTLCDACGHEKHPGGCEYYCAGVEEFDEENGVVKCEDYEMRETT